MDLFGHLTNRGKLYGIVWRDQQVELKGVIHCFGQYTHHRRLVDGREARVGQGRTTVVSVSMGMWIWLVAISVVVALADSGLAGPRPSQAAEAAHRLSPKKSNYGSLNSNPTAASASAIAV